MLYTCIHAIILVSHVVFEIVFRAEQHDRREALRSCKNLTVVMELAPDGCLRDLLDEDPDTPLPKDIQLDYMKQLCRGIKYLHDMKIAHRDFKSLNVFVNGCKMKIGDFGMCRSTDIGATSVAAGATTAIADSSYGTAGWSAPETFQEKKSVDPYKADQYALGVVIWEVATKMFPFKGVARNAIIGSVGYGDQRPGKPEDSSIPQVQQAIAACWKKNPSERKTASQLLDILNGKEQASLAGFSFSSVF